MTKQPIPQTHLSQQIERLEETLTKAINEFDRMRREAMEMRSREEQR